jgi:hypothetical protein
MIYTINTKRDGNQFGGDNGSTGTKEQVIENLLESKKLRNLSDEDQDQLRADLNAAGRAHWGVYTYTLTELPFSEVRIKPANGGFGMWQAEFGGGDQWGDESDLLSAMRGGIDGTLLELGVDMLPEGVVDIRGNIYNEPSRVFAIIDTDGELEGYTGIRVEQ